MTPVGHDGDMRDVHAGGFSNELQGNGQDKTIAVLDP
jgi:hypothetical protein